MHEGRVMLEIWRSCASNVGFTFFSQMFVIVFALASLRLCLDIFDSVGSISIVCSLLFACIHFISYYTWQQFLDFSVLFYCNKQSKQLVGPGCGCAPDIYLWMLPWDKFFCLSLSLFFRVNEIFVFFMFFFWVGESNGNKICCIVSKNKSD